MKEKSLGTQFKTLVKHISDFQYLSLLSMAMVHSATRLQSQMWDLPLGAATRKKLQTSITGRIGTSHTLKVKILSQM